MNTFNLYQYIKKVLIYNCPLGRLGSSKKFGVLQVIIIRVLPPLLLFVLSVSSLSQASELTRKKALVDKNLKTKISFEKKVKFLIAYQLWADKEVTANADKLSDEELTQVMQYSTLMKVMAPKKLTLKNCKAAAERVIDEDLSPISEEPSLPAQAMLGWLKNLCNTK
jgi:hypothetical protein